MKTEIVKVDPKEFGLEESKAAQIAEQFKPMLDKMVELEKEFNEVMALPIEEKSTAAKAKEVRLKYVKVRTGTADIHKAQKAFYLAGGRFVDGWKNAQLFASQGIEEKLEAIEKFAENKERERIDALKQERINLLEPFSIENVDALGLGVMSEEVWNNFYAGTKANYEAKLLAAQKAEEERIEQERKEAEERKRIAEENERLKKEAEEREKQLEEERAKAEAARKKAEQEAERLRLENEKKEAAERARVEAEQKRMREEAQAKIDAERKAREKVEAELKAKAEAEAKAKADMEAAKEAELSKGDSEKWDDFISDLTALKTKYVFKSKKHAALYVKAIAMIDKMISYLNN